MAAPGSGLQISAELRQPVAGPLELRGRPVPFARAVFKFVADALGDFLGFAQSTVHLGEGLQSGGGLSRRQFLQFTNLRGGGLLEALDQRGNLLPLLSPFQFEHQAIVLQITAARPGKTGGRQGTEGRTESRRGSQD